MNPIEYQKRCLETAMFPKEHAITYCVLGLCGEIAEIAEKDGLATAMTLEELIAELGDVMWYCAVLADTLRSEISYAYAFSPVGARYSTSESIGLMAMHAGLIANKAKKVIRDGCSLDARFAMEHIDAITCLVSSCAEKDGTTLEHVMESNIRKLASRKERGVITGSGDNR